MTANSPKRQRGGCRGWSLRGKKAQEQQQGQRTHICQRRADMGHLHPHSLREVWGTGGDVDMKGASRCGGYRRELP